MVIKAFPTSTRWASTHLVRLGLGTVRGLSQEPSRFIGIPVVVVVVVVVVIVVAVSMICYINIILIVMCCIGALIVCILFSLH